MNVKLKSMLHSGVYIKRGRKQKTEKGGGELRGSGGVGRPGRGWGIRGREGRRRNRMRNCGRVDSRGATTGLLSVKK